MAPVRQVNPPSAPFMRSSFSQTARLKDQPTAAATECLESLQCHCSASTALQATLPQQAVTETGAAEEKMRPA